MGFEFHEVKRWFFKNMKRDEKVNLHIDPRSPDSISDISQGTGLSAGIPGSPG